MTLTSGHRPSSRLEGQVLTRGAVLIAAFSGRALAASARRAGYAPYVADFFADDDTRACAAKVRRLEGGIASGFEKPSLLTALTTLAEADGEPPLGLVYGAGFEDRPALLGEIAECWPLLGNAPETVRAAKDPWGLSATLRNRDIPHPEIRADQPREKGWLAKPAGRAGGVGIAYAGAALHDAQAIYQRYVAGKAVSALFLTGPHGTRIVGFSEQWTAPTRDVPFRFGGAVRPASCGAGLLAELAEATVKAAEAFGLCGLNSIDFIVGEREWWLIEINPRPGATLDLFDDGRGRLFSAHIAAVGGNVIPALPGPSGAAALQIVYTPGRIAYFPHGPWPDWIADRPSPGSSLAEQDPCYTVLATGKTACDALRLCRERASQKLVYVETPRMDGSAMSQAGVSVNARARRLVDEMLAESAALHISASRGTLGQLLVDAGVSVPGSIEAGLRIGAICMGGLGQASLVLRNENTAWKWAIQVSSSDPVTACLASQYAGWNLAHGEGADAYSVLGSGPGRAIARKEALFDDLRYRDDAACAVFVLEAKAPPPEALVEKIAADCRLPPKDLVFIYASTESLAGTVQVLSRVLEVALHKAHMLNFAVERIVDGVGAAPLAPSGGSFATAMARTNDAIIYGGHAHLFVTGPEDDARDLAHQLPSSTSRDHGRSFGETFKAVNYDFYAIDPMLFSPAAVSITALETGKTFHAGAIDETRLDASFA